MKKKLVTALRIGAIYVGIMVVLELSGQLLIRWLEARKPSGITAENILSHQEPVLGFGLKKHLNESMGHWTVNSDRWGFRGGNSFPARNDSNEKRLFVVGGSTVFGWGVAEEDTVPGELQKAIDEEQARLGISSPRVRVINAGVPWYASWHEAALIYFRLLELSPDWIIVMDGLNDTANGVAPTWKPIYEGYVDTPTQLAFQRRKESGSFAASIMEMLKISPTLRYVFARLNAREQTKQGVYHDGVWEQYLSYQSKARELSLARGVRYSLFFQPVMLVDKPLDYFDNEFCFFVDIGILTHLY